ncbi:MAG: hypothetical protein K6G00_09075 [Treponema sp.]|nr:hypothetical protein [Treponema sp.]
MTAYIPHKDTLLILSKIQKSIITAYNAGKTQDNFIYPEYPLFAFAKEASQSENKKISGCSILFPEAENNELYFPFILTHEDGSKETLQIKFAKSNSSIKKAPEINSGAFPMQVRIFRKARAVIEYNSWQIFDEKWLKL